MSASHPKATESLRSSEMTAQLSARTSREQSQQSSPLFDHLVGAGELSPSVPAIAVPVRHQSSREQQTSV
jgi:hypothetical protein